MSNLSIDNTNSTSSSDKTPNNNPSPQPIDRKKEKTLLGKVLTQQHLSSNPQQYHSTMLKNLDSLKSFRKSSSSASAVITINVGGVLYTTFKDTLSRKINGKDHLLSVMFSNEDHFDFSRDDKGYIFIDRNGNLFSYILDYLRCGGDVKQFALPIHNPCLMHALEIEFEFFNFIDLCVLLRGRRKTFKIEKKKYTKIKTPTNNKSGSELMSDPTSSQLNSNSATVKSVEIISKQDQSAITNEDEDTNDDTSSILLEENDELDDEFFERKLEDDLLIAVDHYSDSSEDFDEDVIFIEPPTADAVLTPSSEPNVIDDEDSVSTFDAAIKSVNDEVNLVIHHKSSSHHPTPLLSQITHQREKHKSNALSKKQKSTLFSSFHNIKHKICNEKGESVIGYSEDASICYIYPNLSRYYYPIICKQPIQLRGVDRRLSKCYNYYEITINSDFEEKIDYVNYNIPGIVVAVMSNKNIKVLKQHHKKDLPIDLKKETVTSFNLKNGSYYSNEEGKHVIAIRRFLCGDRVGVHFDAFSRVITLFYNGATLFTTQCHLDQITSSTRLYFVVLVKSMYGVVPSYITLFSNAQHPFKYWNEDPSDDNKKLQASLKLISKRLGDVLTSSNDNEGQNYTTVSHHGKSSNKR
ncbi:hypothetical protein C9374_013980 [Naegleria lovaniensis]|uniref:Potassium channel tetramerisation-type BTB domain-containing protein n=1 Tax=Naegleria lovaniensis TaxID=51637 RepID=A0AA88GUZ4_NAELO|nr:uncharacterized protein C9374_013980 [Naegleria lovaniensis]KAG2389420.1 hypothetical protein C9374_013980 [Naegleria lovaniensis]